MLFVLGAVTPGIKTLSRCIDDPYICDMTSRVKNMTTIFLSRIYNRCIFFTLNTWLTLVPLPEMHLCQSAKIKARKIVIL